MASFLPREFDPCPVPLSQLPRPARSRHPNSADLAPRRRIIDFVLTVLCGLLLFPLSPSSRAAWTAGVARADVTPSDPIRLTGYAVRQTSSEGVAQKLWVKALALRHDDGEPAVLATLDNCGITDAVYLRIADRVRQAAGVNRDRLALCLSHTHTGPCTTGWAPNIFVKDIDPADQAVIDPYTEAVIDAVANAAAEAVRGMRPAQVSWSQGSADFARNRRTEGGPVDHAMPVLRVTDADDQGALRALVANYACHCTTLGGEFNRIHGDWAGAAQEAIERNHSGAMAFVTIGCGADANPHPRGGADHGLALATQHGESLATSVKELLQWNFKPLQSSLRTRMKTIDLAYGPHFTRDQWTERAGQGGVVGYHARKWLARMDAGEPLPAALPFHVQTWTFGNDLAMVFLNGEVVVDYALRLKKELDPNRLWITAYANYVPCYIPSRRILAEGGYEAEFSLWYYDRPQRLAPENEDLIVDTIRELLPENYQVKDQDARFPPPQSPQQALASFRTKAEFEVDLVASEPLVLDPVAIDWSLDGKLWVLEMHDYPDGIPSGSGHSADGTPVSGGRVKVLEDRDGDGRYETATLFLGGLPFPTGLMTWRKGVLVCAAPDILYAEDTDGDGKADLVQTNFSGFATHNFQARVSGLAWGLDGWVHGSGGLFGGLVKSRLTGKEVDLNRRDFRFRPDTGAIEPVAGISQYGRVRDDFGNWFGNDNGSLLWHFPLAEEYARRNPHVVYPAASVWVARANPDAGYDPNRLFPISRTLERFNDPQMANRVTSACGPGIYRDVLLGANYYGNAFVCEPVHNLVTRLVLEPDGATFKGRRAPEESRAEFLASTDNWFRPVQVRTGPDGALWIVDMYRFVIEHPRWIGPDRLKELDTRAGADRGRIYRVIPRGTNPRAPSGLNPKDKAALASALDTANGTVRDMVQRELHVPEQMGRGPDGPSATEFTASDSSGRAQRFRDALSLGNSPDPASGRALAELACGAMDDVWLRAAILSSATQHAAEIFKRVVACAPDSPARREFVRQLIATIVGVGDWIGAAAALESLAAESANPWRWDVLPGAVETLHKQRPEWFANPAKSAVEDAATQRVQNLLDTIRQQASHVALDPEADAGARRGAVTVLGSWADERIVQLLVTRLLDAVQPLAVQQAALDALSRAGQPGTGEHLIAAWPGLTPLLRTRVIPILNSRTPWALAMLGAIEQGRVGKAEIPLAERTRLLESDNAQVRGAAERLFGSESNGDRRALVASYADRLRPLTGHPEFGGSVFDLNCASCHQVRGWGHDVGPDLAEYAGKSADDYLLAILDPNAALHPNHLAYEIEMKDGRALTGIVRNETATSLTLVQANGIRDTLLRADIAGIRASALSLMPEGLEEVIEPQDMADLIAWLRREAPKGFGTASPEEATRARAQFQSGGGRGPGEVRISEEPLPYPSWLGRLPMAYCRQTEGRNRLVWTARPVGDHKAGRTVFRWAAAMGFYSQPSGRFALSVNGRELLTFDVTLEDRVWKDDAGLCRMSYAVKERNSEDSNGVLEIELSGPLAAAEGPVTFEVVGSASASQRWFGLYALND